MSHNDDDDNLLCSQKEWRRREQQRLGNMYALNAQNALSVRDRETLAAGKSDPATAQPNPVLLLCD